MNFSKIGLIEWVDKTEPIRSLVVDPLWADEAYHERNEALLGAKSKRGQTNFFDAEQCAPFKEFLTKVRGTLILPPSFLSL